MMSTENSLDLHASTPFKWHVIIMLIEKTTITLQALAELEARLTPQGRKVTVVTQNIDGLHHKAGSQDIIELHGIKKRN